MPKKIDFIRRLLIIVIEYWLSNNAGGSVTANGIAGKVTIRQLAIFKNYIKCHSIWFLGVSLG